MGQISNWLEVLRTCNLSPDKEMCPVSKWLIITRACVFVMTILSGLIGGMLAVIDGHFSLFNLFNLLIIVIGLMLAHAANNMLNDYWDVRQGIDTSDYPRAKYAPHPILDNMVSTETLLTAIAVCYVADFIIAIYFTFVAGWQVLLFAFAGVFFSVFYVAPPLNLKHRGLGELAIFLIWGPLITVGSYYVLAKAAPVKVWLASIPYGLAVTTVIMGKHLDKAEKDSEKGVKTLAVLLGNDGAVTVMRILIMSFYAVIAVFSIFRILPWWSLLAFISVMQAKRFMATLSEPAPATPQEAFKMAEDVIPKDMKEKFDPNLPADAYPLWPLWYAAWGVWWTRIAGGLFVLGLLISAIIKAI